MAIVMRGSPLAVETELTEVYKKYEDAHPALREAMCLRVQYSAVALQPTIEEGDLFAWRGRELGVAIGFRTDFGGFACAEDWLRKKLEAARGDKEDEQRLHALLDFWKDRTAVAHYQSRVARERPENIERGFPYEGGGPTSIGGGPCPIGGFSPRMATHTLDFDKLLRLGIPGLTAEVEERRRQAEDQGGGVGLFEGMRICLELLVEVCDRYAVEARRKRMAELAQTLENITVAPPGTLREAIQLLWLYRMLAQVSNFGRMDVYLGDFLARDLEFGTLSEEEALSLLEFLWHRITDRFGRDDGGVRILVGGVGRRHEENADRFALLAMEATRRTRLLNPQLTLRMYRGMNRLLMGKALDVLAEGLTFPVLVNDDVSVPAVRNAFSCSREEAEQYVLNNCGDLGLDHMSFGSPNSIIQVAKALEVTLNNGVDMQSGMPMGLALGDLRDFETFDGLFDAYKKQVEFFLEDIADCHEAFNEVAGENAFLFLSMLNDDCLVRGKSMFNGGLRYLGGLVETYGTITAADSLTAIKRLVYDEKSLSQEQMLAALKANFRGYERGWALMRKCPKYGNDDGEADRMASAVNSHLFKSIWKQKRGPKLHFLLAENVNAEANVGTGQGTAASADGRLSGMPLSNANNPTGGNDRAGPTALLNSLAKLDVSHLGPGVFQGLTLDRSLFASHRDQVRCLLDTFFANGGVIIQVSVIDREQLQEALENPEQHPDLVVRVGGFSARFIDLDRDLQREIAGRTVH